MPRRKTKRRRPRGSGGIFSRGGAVVATWRGTQRRFPDRASAEAYLAECRAESRDETRPDGPVTVGHFLGTWWLAREALWRSSWKTHREYRRRLQAAESIAELPLRELDHRRCQAWLGELSARYAPTYVRGIRAMVTRALDDAVPDLIAVNPLRRTQLPKAPRPEPPAYDADQVRALRLALVGDPLEALVVTALATGLRLGEVRGLQWSDLDPGAGALTIRRQRSERAIADPDAVGPTKTRRTRVADLHPAAASVLSGLPRTSIWLFPNPATGHPWAASTVRRRFKGACIRAGIPVRTFHALRHTAISLAIDAGEPIPEVAHYAGHSSPAVTMRIYAHRVGGRRGRVADAVGRLLGPDSGS